MKYILFLIGLSFFASCTPTSKMSKTSPIQYLEVPENRTKQNGKSMQLAYTQEQSCWRLKMFVTSKHLEIYQD